MYMFFLNILSSFNASWNKHSSHIESQFSLSLAARWVERGDELRLCTLLNSAVSFLHQFTQDDFTSKVVCRRR